MTRNVLQKSMLKLFADMQLDQASISPDHIKISNGWNENKILDYL